MLNYKVWFITYYLVVCLKTLHIIFRYWCDITYYFSGMIDNILGEFGNEILVLEYSSFKALWLIIKNLKEISRKIDKKQTRIVHKRKYIKQQIYGNIV